MNCGLEFRVVTPADHHDIHMVPKTAVEQLTLTQSSALLIFGRHTPELHSHISGKPGLYNKTLSHRTNRSIKIILIKNQIVLF